jgi:hypothetical protein
MAKQTTMQAMQEVARAIIKSKDTFLYELNNNPYISGFLMAIAKFLNKITGKKNG